MLRMCSVSSDASGYVTGQAFDMWRDGYVDLVRLNLKDRIWQSKIRLKRSLLNS